MSIWIRAICTRPLGDITPDDLRAGIAERLPRLCALYGEPDPSEVIARLCITTYRPDKEGALEVLEIHYREDDPERSLDVERWVDPAMVKEEVDELLEELEDCEEERVDEVREVLGRAVETAAIELKMSDTERVGWPLAIAAAAALAARGEGLIQADGEGWMAPQGDGVEHLLDAD